MVSRIFLSTIWLAVLAFGCSREKKVLLPEIETTSEETTQTGEMAFRITYQHPYGFAKAASVDRMTAYVYEADNTEITHRNLEKVGNMGRATISLSVGDNRRVSIVAYEDTLVRWIGWDDDVDILAGQTTTADIVMGYAISTLKDLPDCNC